MATKLFEVSLLAVDIQVTADNPAMADRYAREDARECRRQWNYAVTSVSEALAGSAATEDPYDIVLRLTQTGRKVKRGAGQLYTFNLACDSIIAAEDETTAGAAAIAFITESAGQQCGPG